MTNQIELQRQQLARDRQTPFAEMEVLKTEEAQFEVSQRDARAKLDNKHTALQAEKEKWAHINEIIATDFADSEVIELNVGGKFFTTTRHTLVKHPMSMLGAMFSGRHVLPRDSSGRVFIDRNGEVFGYLLDWLRTGRIPTIPPELEAAFAEEFDFFALEVKRHNPPSKEKLLQGFQLVVSHPFMEDKSRKTSGLVPRQSGPLDTGATSERAVIATFPSEVMISGLTLSVLYGAKNGLCGDGGAVDYWDGSKWVEIAKIPSASFMGQQQKTHQLSWDSPVASSQWRIRGVTAATTTSSAVFNRETPPSPPLGANLGINLLQFQ